MTIKTFDKQNLKTVRDMLNVYLETLSENELEGMTFKVGNMRFTDNEVTIQLSATTEGAAADKTEYVAAMCRAHGIPKTENRGATIIDYHPKKIKYPFIVMKADGKRYKMSPEEALRNFH